jgi:hypothetical protein
VRALLIAAILLAYAAGSWRHKDPDTLDILIHKEALTSEVLAEFRALDPKVPRGANIVFLEDPFAGYDMAFITELWFRDRSLSIRLNQKTPLPPGEIDRADVLFAWKQGKLARVR